MITQDTCHPSRAFRPHLSSGLRRVTGALSGLLTVLFLMPSAPLAAAGCPSLQAGSLSPSTLVDGDAATLSGDGFCTGSSYFGWVSDGTQGVPLVLQGDTTQKMNATVGPVAGSITGTVRLIKGQTVQLPDAVVQASTGLYAVRNTQIILGQETASGGAVKVDPSASSSGTVVGSTLVGGELVLQFPAPKSLQKADSHDKSIAVVVVIKTCGEPSGGGDDNDGNNNDPWQVAFPIAIEWAGRLEGQCFGKQDVCSGGPATFVAAAINDRFGATGLKAEAVPVLGAGTEVTVSHRGCPIDQGSVTVAY